MDQAESRGDVDSEKLFCVAVSRDTGSRLTFSAVDEPFRAVVYVGDGIDERVRPTLPEAHNVNFAPHLRAPRIFLNGRNDEEHR